MRDPNAYRTWSRQRACRLPTHVYEGYAAHLVIASREREAVFTPSAFSAEVFALVTEERQTLAACLMPDHLHWLLQITGDISARIGRFKSLSTRIGWRYGRSGALWQRTFYDRLLRDASDVRKAACYILDNPVRAGLVERIEKYPYQVLAMKV